MHIKQVAPMRARKILAVREDSAGDGRFGAKRGARKHMGVDLSCFPGSVLLCSVSGTVTKHGYCYRDDPMWRYVEVTDSGGLRHRYFYVEPLARIGASVSVDDAIGVAQDITLRYPGQGMTPHIHYEVKTASGRYIDPGSLLSVE